MDVFKYFGGWNSRSIESYFPISDFRKKIEDFLINCKTLGINLIKKAFFRVGLSLGSVNNPIKKGCKYKSSEYYDGGNNTGLNSRIEITHGVLPPSAGLVCGNPIIPREGAFYKPAGTGGAP